MHILQHSITMPILSSIDQANQVRYEFSLVSSDATVKQMS